MSSNKSARRELERIFGKICMVEAAGIRYIPKEKRKKIKGYSRYDDVITFHHIHERAKGGKATPENGALVKGYNHRWIHSLSEEKKDEVNQKLQEFKITMIQTLGDKIFTTHIASIPIEMDPTEEFDTIPVYDTDKKKKFNRAKEKREFQKRIDEYYLGDDSDER